MLCGKLCAYVPFCFLWELQVVCVNIAEFFACNCFVDLQRRMLEVNERILLREKNIVTEMQCDLGLCLLSEIITKLILFLSITHLHIKHNYFRV